MATRGRNVVLVAGAAAGLALASAALLWRPLAVRWYTARLEGERDLLLDLSTAAPGSPAHETVLVFARTPEGKDRLLEVYLEAVFASGQDFQGEFETVRTYSDGAWSLFWLEGEEMHSMGYHDMPNWSFRGGGSAWSVHRVSHRGRPLAPLLAALQGFLLEVGYDRHSLPGDPGLTFSVVARRDGEEGILASPMSWDHWTEGRVVLIEATGRQWSREGR